MKESYLAGIHSVEQCLLRQPDSIVTLYISDKKLNQRLQKVLDLANQSKVSVEKCGESFLDKIHAQHQGVAAQLKAPKVWSEGDILEYLEAQTNPMVVILDEVQDPHNVGAVLRTAAALGVSAVIAPEKKACGLTPAARKTASGGDLIVPFAQVKNLARFMRQLQDNQFWIVGTALAEQAKPLNSIDLTGKVALVLGSEGTGIRKNTQAHCDFLAQIPMNDTMASLNVSVACGICLYESFTQRQKL